MGKYLKNFKDKTQRTGGKLKELEASGKFNRKEKMNERRFHSKKRDKLDSTNDDYEEDYNDSDERYDDDYINDGEMLIRPTQRPESFYHFILENQYKDLERSIRGLKDVWDKENQKWITKRKELHCFTDEEAEDILRTAQSHLATDVKLGWIKKEIFGDYMNALYKELAFLFESIAEYRYGRYGEFDVQHKMKLQNHKIFLELFTRVQANYSRAVNGTENKFTHDSVKGQESLQNTDRDYTKQRGYN